MTDQTTTKEKGFVLIVDDIPKNLQLLGQTLRSEGYRVAAVSEGEQVLPSAHRYDPDLILLDVMMPDKDGFEVCRDLKENEELKSIPIVFLTAKAEQDNIVHGLELGGADYITKPFNTRELLARVETHVALKQSRDELSNKNEELESAITAKDRIYSVIGHDLRSPVNAIMGLSELLLYDFGKGQEPDAAKLKKFLGIINQSSSHLGHLLTDLLNWARLQTDDLELHADTFSPVKTLKMAIDLMNPVAKKKDVKLRLRYEDDPELVGDKRLISTIIRNFISNAIKYSYKGGVVDIELLYNPDYLHISVTDEGRGMPPEVKNNLFNSDSHPSKRGTENEQGAGFGLLLCNQLANLYKGKIQVESEEGEGSTFTLLIPALTHEPVMA